MKVKPFVLFALAVFFLVGCNSRFTEEHKIMLEKIREAPEKSALLKKDGKLFGIKSSSHKDGSFSIKCPDGLDIPSVQLPAFIRVIKVVVGPSDPGYVEYMTKVD